MAKKIAPEDPPCQPGTSPAPVLRFPDPPPANAPLPLDPLPNIITAGGIALMVGASNLGKTALSAGMAKDFRDSTPIFGHQPNPLPGLGFVNADRSWERGAGVWFERVGFPEVRSYSMPDDPKFDPRSLRRKFERTALLFSFVDRLQLPAGSLLYVDPIGLFLGGNLNDYDTCAVACHEIRTLLRQRGLTLIGTAHTSKLKADKRDRYNRAQDQILGSTALLGFSDTTMCLVGPEETGRSCYTFLWASHLQAPETFQLERNEQGIFQLAKGGDKATCDRVLALFPEDGEEITKGEVITLARAIPQSERTVHRAVDQLIAEGLISKVRRGTYRRVVGG